jgi:hypothetical protein
MDRLENYFAGYAARRRMRSRAFWGACHGGQQEAAEFLLERGAELRLSRPQLLLANPTVEGAIRSPLALITRRR